MRTAPLLLFVLLFSLNVAPAFAQKIIRGRVTDAGTGAGLPAAHVAVIGQRAGTVTNADGNYQFGLPPLPVKVRFSSIGYYSKEFEIGTDSPDSLDVALAQNPVVLDEILVTDEDPAERIMREVIRRKQIWRAGLEKYTATGYTRITLGNSKKTVMKVEAVLDVAWDKGKGFTTRQKAKRQTGKEPPKGDVSFSNLNLYDDYITVFDQRIFGITHPNALDQYTFAVIGRRMIDDKTVYDLSVAPKNRFEKLLVGRISVLDGDFAVIEAKLRPNTAIKLPLGKKEVAALRKAFLPPPKLDMEIALEQQFDNFGGDCWLPIGEKFTGKLDLGWQKLLALPSIRWEETARFTDFTVTAAANPEPSAPVQPPKKKPGGVQFKAERGEISIGVSAPSSADSDEAAVASGDTTASASANPADSTLIRDTDFIPPTITIYTASDSTTAKEGGDMPDESALALFEAFRPTGVIGNIIAAKAEKEIKKDIEKDKKKAEQARKPSQPDTTKTGDKPRKLEKRGSLGSLDWMALPHWSYNRVDGHNTGLKIKTTARKKYTAEVLGLFQSERDQFTYDGKVTVPLGGKSVRPVLEFRAAEGTARTSGSPVYSPFVNSVLTLLGNDDYFDYYRSVSQGATVRFSVPTHRFDASAGINRERHRSLGKETDFDILGRDTVQRLNPPVEEGRLGSVTLSLGYGDEAIPYLLGSQRRVEFAFEYADPGMFSSDFAFRKYQTTIDWRFNTLFRQGMEPNTLDIRLLGMVSEGDLPLQRFGRIDSGNTPFTPYGSFRARRSPLAGEQLCALFWEHNFRTVPFEILHLNLLVRRHTELILQGAAGRTWVSDDRRAGLPGGYPDRFHHELGLTINNIYAGTLITATKDLNSRHATWGIGYQRSF